MIKSRIMVTGETGKTGSVVVAEPLNAAYHVRTMMRREDGRSSAARAFGSAYRILRQCWTHFPFIVDCR